MTQFVTQVLNDQAESVMFGAWVGDMELAVIDAGHDGVDEYVFVAYAISREEPEGLHEMACKTFREAMELLSSFTQGAMRAKGHA